MLTNQLIGGVSGPGLDLPGAGGQFDAARGAVEMVGVVRLAAEPQGLSVDDGAEEISTFLMLFKKTHAT